MPTRRRRCGSSASRALLRCVFLFLIAAMLPMAQSRALLASILPLARAYASSPSDTSAIVTTTADTVDGSDTSSIARLNAQPGLDGAISLREAMQAANATAAGTALTIDFAIPSTDAGYDSSAGVWTIALGSALPKLTRRNILIDGTTAAATAYPPIVLDGFNVNEAQGMSNGINISASDITIKGLTLMNFYDAGVLISGSSATNNHIQGCYIGVDAHGLGAQPNGTGVVLSGGASNNTIGGSSASARNLISGNNWDSGVLIQGAATAHNTIAGNWIGTNSTGQAALGNLNIDGTFWTVGIRISGGAHDNTIGGSAAGSRNVIAGNDGGIYIDGSAANTVAGNIIGLAADGHTPLGNVNGGVFVVGGARNNLIGGTATGAGNVISGNGVGAPAFGQGVYISDPGTAGNTVAGNYIGVDSTGNSAGGNYRQGVLITLGASGNTIGGATAGAGNVIAYNGQGGLRLDSSANQVLGNRIGVGVSGAQLGNQSNGVRIAGDDNVIGPNNLIAYNQLSGIMLTGRNALIANNTLQANTRSGICVAGASTTITSNLIIDNGGAAADFPDCNIQGGIVITNTSSTQVTNNDIFDNQGVGVTVYGGSVNSLLSNSISGNSVAGIQLVSGGNSDIQPPVFRNVGPSAVSGMSCAFCRVEVFTDTGNQGRYYVGATSADSRGFFQLALPLGSLQGSKMTATLTDPSGNTSPFAPAINIPQPPPDNSHYLYLPLIRR